MQNVDNKREREKVMVSQMIPFIAEVIIMPGVA